MAAVSCVAIGTLSCCRFLPCLMALYVCKRATFHLPKCRFLYAEVPLFIAKVPLCDEWADACLACGGVVVQGRMCACPANVPF